MCDFRVYLFCCCAMVGASTQSVHGTREFHIHRACIYCLAVCGLSYRERFPAEYLADSCPFWSYFWLYTRLRSFCSECGSDVISDVSSQFFIPLNRTQRIRLRGRLMGLYPRPQSTFTSRAATNTTIVSEIIDCRITPAFARDASSRDASRILSSLGQ